jgi:hypothetical protein
LFFVFLFPTRNKKGKHTKDILVFRLNCCHSILSLSPKCLDILFKQQQPKTADDDDGK